MIGKATLARAGRAVADFARTHGTFKMQMNLARTSTNPKVLARLYAISKRLLWSLEGGIDEIQLKTELAGNRYTPLAILAELVFEVNRQIRSEAENNPAVRGLVAAAVSSSTSSETLAGLANNPVHLIRRAVGRNPGTHPQVMMKLADDKEMGVKIAVALNPTATLEILLKLAGGLTELDRKDHSEEGSGPTSNLLWDALEGHPLVKELAETARENISADLRKLAKQKLPFLCVRKALANNRNTPGDTLADLAKDSNEHVRAGVARHQNTSLSVLAALAEDKDQFVRTAALATLHTPKT